MNSINKVLMIKNSGQLTASDGRIIYKKNKEDEAAFIPLNDIRTIYIDDHCDVVISSKTLSSLIESNIWIFILNEKHRPSLLVSSFMANVFRSRNIATQMNWNKRNQEKLWRKIVKNKIINQEWCLLKNKKGTKGLLTKRLVDIKSNDINNVEGVCAREYFTSLFGKTFCRDDENDIRNYALNYGYAMLAGEITRSIIERGYLTELGIHHQCETNSYNLTYDLIEPFRPIIDDWVINNVKDTFEFEDKKRMVDLLQTNVKLNNKTYALYSSIPIYVQSCLKELESVASIVEVNF